MAVISQNLTTSLSSLSLNEDDKPILAELKSLYQKTLQSHYSEKLDKQIEIDFSAGLITDYSKTSNVTVKWTFEAKDRLVRLHLERKSSHLIRSKTKTQVGCFIIKAYSSHIPQLDQSVLMNLKDLLNKHYTLLHQIQITQQVLEKQTASSLNARSIKSFNQELIGLAVELNKGNERLSKNELHSALECFKKILEIDPVCAEALLGKCKILSNPQNYLSFPRNSKLPTEAFIEKVDQEVKKTLEGLLNTEPTNPNYLFHHAFFLYYRSFHQKAEATSLLNASINLCNKILTDQTSPPILIAVCLLQKGKTYFQLRKWEKALKNFSDLLKLKLLSEQTNYQKVAKQYIDEIKRIS